MRILTSTELKTKTGTLKGVNSPSGLPDATNISEVYEKQGKFIYKTADGEKEIKADGGLKKVVVALSTEDWFVTEDGKATYTITPAMLTLPPSVTYTIEMQVFNYKIMVWERVAVTPKIDQEGNIIITSLQPLECNVIVTSGLTLPPPKPVPPKIYGVDQVGRSNPIGLPRTDDAVGMGYRLKTIDNNQVYESDFDNVYPYSDIKEVTDASGNVFVRIPKFYHKFTLNSDGTYKVQISNTKIDDTWLTCFINAGQEIDYMDIGKYEASFENNINSISNVGVTTSWDINGFRNFCMKNGTGYHQFDIWNYEVIKLLFLVEFATTNSQNIMYGYTNSNTNYIKTGSCDGIVTGSPVSVTDGKHGCTYRGIENPWGNYEIFCDGINFNNLEIYICDDVTKYQSDKYDTEYKLAGVGIKSTNSWIKTMSPCTSTYFQLMIPMKDNGSENTYYCDKGYYGGSVLRTSGARDAGSIAGLWTWITFISSEAGGSGLSCRLCRKPIAGTNFN